MSRCRNGYNQSGCFVLVFTASGGDKNNSSVEIPLWNEHTNNNADKTAC